MSYPAGELRAALVAAGVAMVEEGRAVPGLREIARRVGVTPTATYRHFASKGDLLAAIVEAGSHDLAADFASVPDRASEAGLLRLAEAYLDFALRRPAMFRLMFGGDVPLRGPDGEAIPDPAYDIYLGAVAGLAESSSEDIATGEHAIRLWSCVHGFTMLAIDERVLAPALDHDLLRRVVAPVIATIAGSEV